MAKKTPNVIDDDFNLDDFDSSFDFDIPDPNVKDDRKPVIKAMEGFKEGAIAHAKTPAFYKKILKEALPSSFGQSVDMADEVTESAKSLYDESFKEIKPTLMMARKTISKLVPPDAAMVPKKLQAVFQKWREEPDEDGPSSPSKDRVRETLLAQTQKEIFQAQQEVDQGRLASQIGRDNLHIGLEQMRYKTTLAAANRSAMALQRLDEYNTTIGINYQKKSLELQYRLLFATQDILEFGKQDVIKRNEYLASIAKNTALPEFVKLTSKESAQEMRRRKLDEMTNNALFGGIDKALVGGIDKLKKKVLGGTKDFMQDMRSGMQEAQMQGGMIASGEAGDPTKLAGSVAGDAAASGVGGIAGWLGKKGYEKFQGSAMDKKLGVTDKFHKLDTKLTDLPNSINEAKRSRKYDYDDSIKGSFMSWAQGFLPDMGADKSLKVTTSQNLTDASQYTVKTDRAITEVIPGYLSRILREVQVLRTGNKDVQLTGFSHDRGTFNDEGKLLSDIAAKIAPQRAKARTKSNLDEIMAQIDPNGEMSTEERAAIKKRMLTNSVERLGANHDRLASEEQYAGEKPDVAKAASTKMGAFLSKMTPAQKAEFTRKHHKLSDDMADPRQQMQEMLQSGDIDLLRKQNLLIESNGSTQVNVPELIKRYLEDNPEAGGGTSSFWGPNGPAGPDAPTSTSGDKLAKALKRSGSAKMASVKKGAKNMASRASAAMPKSMHDAIKTATATAQNLKSKIEPAAASIKQQATHYAGQAMQAASAYQMPEMHMPNMASIKKSAGDVATHATSTMQAVADYQLPKDLPKMGKQAVSRATALVPTKKQVQEAAANAGHITKKKAKEAQAAAARVARVAKQKAQKFSANANELLTPETLQKAALYTQDLKDRAVETSRSLKNRVNQHVEDVVAKVKPEQTHSSTALALWHGPATGVGDVQSKNPSAIDVLVNQARASMAQFNPTAEDIALHAQNLRDHAGGAVNRLKDRISQPVEDVVEKVKSDEASFKERIAEAKQKLAQHITDGKDKLKEQINQKVGPKVDKLREQMNSGNSNEPEQFDLYVGDEKQPRISALKLAQGHYSLKETGEVITSMTQVKGAIVDEHGKVVVAPQELSKLVYFDPKHGNWKHLHKTGMGIGDIAQNLGSSFKKNTMLLAKSGISTIQDQFKKTGPSDIYVEGEKLPRLYASKMEKGYYTDAISGETITSAKDIKGPIKDETGQIVVSGDELGKLCLYNYSIGKWSPLGMINKALKGIGWLGKKAWEFETGIAWKMTKWNFRMLGKGLKLVGGMLGLRKNKDTKDGVEITDVYVEGEKTPRLEATKFKKGAYFHRDTSEPLTHPKDINGPVMDSQGNTLLDAEDIKHLVIYNTTLGRFSPLRILGKILSAPFKALAWLGKKAIKGLGAVAKPVLKGALKVGVAGTKMAGGLILGAGKKILGIQRTATRIGPGGSAGITPISPIASTTAQPLQLGYTPTPSTSRSLAVVGPTPIAKVRSPMATRLAGVGGAMKSAFGGAFNRFRSFFGSSKPNPAMLAQLPVGEAAAVMSSSTLQDIFGQLKKMGGGLGGGGGGLTETLLEGAGAGGLAAKAGGLLKTAGRFAGKVAGKAAVPLAAAAAAYGGIKSEAGGKKIDNLKDIVPDEWYNKINPFAYAMNAGRYGGNKLNQGYGAISSAVGGSGSLGSDLYGAFNKDPMKELMTDPKPDYEALAKRQKEGKAAAINEDTFYRYANGVAQPEAARQKQLELARKANVVFTTTKEVQQKQAADAQKKAAEDAKSQATQAQVNPALKQATGAAGGTGTDPQAPSPAALGDKSSPNKGQDSNLAAMDAKPTPTQADVNPALKQATAGSGGSVTLDASGQAAQDALNKELFTQAEKSTGKVSYKMGSKNLASGSIDCSGWIETINKTALDTLAAQAPGLEAKKIESKIYNGMGAAGIVKNLEDNGASPITKENLTADKLQEGMIIGENNGGDWAKGRHRGIDHITQVLKEPGSGKLLVSQSQGGKGVTLTPVEKYLSLKKASKKNQGLFAVDLTKPYDSLTGGKYTYELGKGAGADQKGGAGAGSTSKSIFGGEDQATQLPKASAQDTSNQSDRTANAGYAGSVKGGSISKLAAAVSGARATPGSEGSPDGTGTAKPQARATPGGMRGENTLASGPADPTAKVPTPQGSGAQAMMPTIEGAAKLVGIDKNTVSAVIAVESGFDPNAKARGSSATGLGQFTTSTWRAMMDKYGAKYGLDPGCPPTDAKANSIMTAQYLKDNCARITAATGAPAGATEAYMGHFLGGGGASSFFKLLKDNPNAPAADGMPKAAAANKAIFYDNGRPRTVQEIYSLMESKLQKRSKEFGIDPPALGSFSLSSKKTATGSSTDPSADGAEIGGGAVGKSVFADAPADATAPIASPGSPQTPVAPPRPVAAASAMASLPGPQIPTASPMRGPSPMQASSMSGGMDASVFSKTEDILTKSLGIQTEMRDALSKLVGLLPEAMKSLGGGAAASAPAGADKPAPKPGPAYNLPQPVISMKRVIA